MGDDLTKTTLVWCDIETTGLDPSGHSVIEVAAYPTNTVLSPIEGFNCEWPRILRPEAGDVWQREALLMHSQNGLIEDCYTGSITSTLSSAHHEFADWLIELRDTVKGQLVLAGNSVHFDLEWLRCKMPRAAGQLHYRVFDVRTLMAAAQWWTGGVSDRYESDHRALGDMQRSLRLARICRDWAQNGG